MQQEGEERRERADCAWISETLNAGIDVTVLRWYFGDAPVLARVSIDAPKNEDRTILANLVAEMVGLGAQVPIEPVMKRLNVPVAKEGEKLVFTAPAVAEPSVPGGATIATNVRESRKSEVGSRKSPEAELDNFLGPLRDEYFQAFAGDMRPLGVALDAVLAEGDAIAFNSKLTWLRSQLPSLLTEINASPKSADALAAILKKSFEHGYTQAAEERKAA